MTSTLLTREQGVEIILFSSNIMFRSLVTPSSIAFMLNLHVQERDRNYSIDVDDVVVNHENVGLGVQYWQTNTFCALGHQSSLSWCSVHLSIQVRKQSFEAWIVTMNG